MALESHWNTTKLTPLAVLLFSLAFGCSSDRIDSDLLGLWCSSKGDGCQSTRRFLSDGSLIVTILEETCKPTESAAGAVGRSLVPKKAKLHCEQVQSNVLDCELSSNGIRWTALCAFFDCSSTLEYHFEGRDRLILIGSEGNPSSYLRASEKGCGW